MKEELTSEQQIRRKTLKAFVGFGIASLVPLGLWKWIKSSDKLDYLSVPLRKTLEFNEKLTSKLLSNSHLAPIFSKSQAERKVRFNGAVGLQSPLAEDYKIVVESGEKKFEITLDDLKALPKQEIVFEFKCIEGWSQIQHWGGVRFVDFINHFKIGQKDADSLFEYVSMETPDSLYFVGVDMPSAIHPQTILAYEMNGKLLLKKHGSPLRLIIPVKYGYKSLKRVGKISFSDERPKDYWALFGYDYFAGL